jgi:hypothetical protein
MRPTPNTTWNFTASAPLPPDFVQAMDTAFKAIAKFAARTGSVPHSFKANGRRVRMYYKINAGQSKRNVERADHNFADLKPQHDYDSDVPAELPPVAPMPSEALDEPFDAPPKNKGGRPRKNPL